MTNKRAKHQNRALYAILVALICLFGVLVLCSCNSDGNIKESEKEYSLYLSDITYSESESTMYIDVTLSGDEDRKLQSTLDWKTRTYAISVWYNRQDVEMSLNSSEVCRELDEMISDDEREHDGVKYNHLKVVLRYDTIYKSINSDAQVTKSGRYYMHRFALDEELNSETFKVWLKSQNSANWYAILIACGIAFAAVITGVALSIKGGVWQKKKKKNE